MIILYSEKINYNFIQILNKYEKMDFTLNFKCPYCNSDDLIKWGFYNRYLCFLENNIINDKIIKIQRLKCKNCNKTHALLPSFIVPYKTFALDIILHTLSNISSLSVSFDTSFLWNKQFNRFLPYLKTMFYNLSKLDIINCLLKDIFNNYKQFFSINKKILMMSRPGIYNMAPF